MGTHTLTFARSTMYKRNSALVMAVYTICLCLFFLVTPAWTDDDTKCYSCRNCDESLKNFIDNENDETKCTGSCYKFSGTNNDGDKTSSRGCLAISGKSVKFDSGYCTNGQSSGYVGKLCICNGDKCNSGARVKSDVTVWGLGMLLACVIVAVLGRSRDC